MISMDDKNRYGDIQIFIEVVSIRKPTEQDTMAYFVWGKLMEGSDKNSK